MGQKVGGSNTKEVGIIVGNVVDAISGKPLPYASVAVSCYSNTIKQPIQITDKNGAFEFDNLPMGFHKLKISATGYTTTTIDSISIRAERYDFNMGDIKIALESSNLDEVVVYAEKPLIENKDGKITYNVGESALSNGSSTSEILKSMPLISNDPNGRILLKGKEPKILIDDKPTDLSADQLKDLLESLPGSSIEKIELMVNPPPQYATEQGGVINIVTKKGKIGFTGKVTTSAGTRGEGSISGNGSYRSNKFSTNNVISISGNQFSGNGYSYRQNFYADSTNYFNTNSLWNNKNIRPNLRSQVDYELNKKNNLSFVYQGNFNFFNNENNTQFTNLSRFSVPYRISNRANGSDGTGYGHNVSFTYTHKGKNVAEVFRFFITGNIGKNDNDKDYFQQFLNPFYQPTGIDSNQSQYFNAYNKSYQLRFSYDKPLKAIKGAFLSTGATYQQGVDHNTLNTSFFRKQDSSFINNVLLSNDFKFYQNIATVRAAITLSIQKTIKLITGVQAENIFTEFNFMKGNVSNTNNNYWNVLPNVTLRKEFDKTFNMALVYRASIRRAGLRELNPNIDYSDPYNIRFGNPTLKPSTADNFDFNCNWVKGKFYINTSLGFNKVKDVFYQIRTLLDAGRTQITYQNIATRKEYEASAWGGYTFTKKFRLNSSIGYTFNQYSEAEKILFKYRDGGSFYTSINYTFTPTSLLTFEGNTKFSSFADPQGRSRSNLNMNIGVQRKFLDKRLIVSFNVFDPIVVQQFTTYVYGSNFSIENFSSTNTRNFRLSIAYQLNKMVTKSKLTNKQKEDAIKKLMDKKQVSKLNSN